MIQKIIEFSIRNKFIIGLFILVWIGLGIWSMQKVPVDATPDITDNQVQIITQAPNLSTEDIEQFVTYPVEKALGNLPEIEHIRSISRFGLSVVTVVFKDKAGTYLPRQLVAEKLEEISGEIPEGFGRPEMGPITTGLGEIYQFTLEVDKKYAEEYSLTELRNIQDWIVSRQMALVPGVVEVNSFGGNIKEYEVAVDPNQLNAMNISISEILAALEKNNQNTGGAYLEKNRQAYFIRGEGLIKSQKDIDRIVVKNTHGIPVRIKDIASVQEGKAIRYGALTANGEGEAVGGMILMLKGANSEQVIHDVKERIGQIEESLPKGIKIKPFIDRSDLIAKTTRTIKTNLIEGGLIVIFILVLFLGNWRGGLIVASAIPLSLLFAFIMMQVFGVWANLMSLGAIDFGIIVDGAVIIVEATVFNLFIRQRKRIEKGTASRDKIALKSAGEMMQPAFFGQLIIIIVFLPILTLGGIEGKMFRPMALTFVFAMIGAMLLCLTYIPMMSALFLKVPKRKKSNWGDRIVGWVEKHYERALKKALEKGKLILAAAMVVLGIAIFSFMSMGGEFIPQLDEGDIAFHAILKPGSSLTETIETTTRIEKMLMKDFPEIEAVVSRIGVADVPTDPMPLDLADIIVSLKPQKEWNFKGSKAELVNAMKETVSVLPGVSYEFTQPIEMRFNELLTGVREDVAIKIFGEDLDVLAQKASEIERLIHDIEGIGDMAVEATSGLPQINIQYDRDKIAQYGLNIQDINNLIQTSFAGKKAGVLFEGERRFDLVVRLQENYRKEISNLEHLFIPTSASQTVPLREVAKVVYQSGPMQISRENTNRRTYVGINIRNRDVKSVVDEIQEKLKNELTLPPGYFIQYGGTFENYENAKNQLQTVVPVAMILIFILIYFALKSFKESLIIYLAIPMAIIGGVFSLWIRGMPFSISAGIGFIVLFGVAVLNGLVLLSGLNELKAEGVTNLKERILLGSKRRVRPIMLTALTDIFGFMPMAISTSAGAEVQQPLATVVIGGLLSATLLTLFILPILYRWIEKEETPGLVRNKVKTKPVLLAGLIVLFSIPGFAQQTPSAQITMDQAIELAKDTHFSLKNKTLEIEQQKALKSGIWEWGNTEIFTSGEELKNGKGIYTLVGIGQQNIDVLGVSARKQLKNSLVHLAETNRDLAELELEKMVSGAWIDTFIAKQKYLLLQRRDSIYARYESAAKLNYEVEAISHLAYREAQKERIQVSLQKEQSFEDYQISKENLNLWFPMNSNFEVSTDLILPEELDFTDIDLKQHPLNKRMTNQREKAEAEFRVAKANYLPKFNFEYGIQKLDEDNGYFSYQAGISLPLFSGKTKSEKRIRQIELEKLEVQQEFHYREMISNSRNALKAYSKWRKAYFFYREKALPLGRLQQESALKAYREGAIGQTELTQILSTSIQTEISGLESLENYLKALQNLTYYITSIN